MNKQQSTGTSASKSFSQQNKPKTPPPSPQMETAFQRTLETLSGDCRLIDSVTKILTEKAASILHKVDNRTSSGVLSQGDFKDRGFRIGDPANPVFQGMLNLVTTADEFINAGGELDTGPYSDDLVLAAKHLDEAFTKSPAPPPPAKRKF